MKRGLGLSTCACLLWLAGCAAPADAPVPAPQAPAAWRNASSAQGAAPVDAHWWRSFGSPGLDATVELAHTQNHDLAMALARVEGARAQARIAGAALSPQLGARIDASRQARLGGQAAVDGNESLVGFEARYELDLWGRLDALQREAAQGLRASEFDRDAVRLAVTAQAASSWLQLQGLRERVAIAGRSLDNAQRVLKLVDARGRAGAALPLELAQQRGLVAARQRELAALRQQANDAQAALAQLLGLPVLPRAADEEGRLDALRPPSIDAGVPSQVLGRRPDIARAEARLAAADANLEAARAALLPSVSLSAAIGLQGQAPGRLIDNPLYSVAAALAAPIFDGGRLRGARDLSEARRQELVAAYRAAIVGAFADAEIALNAVAGSDAQALAQDEEVRQARRAAELSESRYRAGAETLLVLLDAQRTLYAALDLQARLRQERLQARVVLYRALGGGWQGTEGSTVGQAR